MEPSSMMTDEMRAWIGLQERRADAPKGGE
jgi:hypothetical protein